MDLGIVIYHDVYVQLSDILQVTVVLLVDVRCTCFRDHTSTYSMFKSYYLVAI